MTNLPAPASAGSDEAPVLNAMIEDFLAHGGGAEADDALLLKAWLLIGAEYLARATGRRATLAAVDGLRRFVRDAQPARPWRP